MCKKVHMPKFGLTPFKAWLFFAILYSFSLLACDEGTLIVTYQTDAKGSRLDRVRFWVRDDLGRQRFFPRGKAFIEDAKEKSRMVVIRRLPVGQYTLRFLIPNQDRHFGEFPVRSFVMSPGETVRITQRLSPVQTPKPPLLYGDVIVSYEGPEEFLEDVQFCLIDKKGETRIFPENVMEDPLTGGFLAMLCDVPVDEYDLVFYKEGAEQDFIEKRLCSVQVGGIVSMHCTFSSQD